MPAATALVDAPRGVRVEATCPAVDNVSLLSGFTGTALFGAKVRPTFNPVPFSRENLSWRA